jgi:hypothetical protein
MEVTEDKLRDLRFKPAFRICVNLRDLRANAFLSEFAAVQQLRQLVVRESCWNCMIRRYGGMGN